VDKESQDAELGPIENMDIVLDTDPAAPSFKDESDETFVPMRPGLQVDLDFVVVPQQAWDLMRGWYGVADQSPIIVRYAHNTNSPGEDETIEYEINPPIFTIFKLSNPSAGTTPTTLKEKYLSSVKILASRQSNYQKWLKDAKEQAGIEVSTKVRVWKILRLPQSTYGSTATTPAVSRSASPAPAFALVPSKTDTLLMDLNVFLGLSEGSQRELLDRAKDQTNNPNYNGRMNLDVAGLGNADCLVLEEQIGGSKGGDWVSEASAKTLKNLGIPVTQPKTLTIKIAENSPPASAASGRSTPAGPTPIKGFTARGRKGRPHRLLGLENLGNTCYQNSALQCLRAVEELTYYYLSSYLHAIVGFERYFGR
jgi:ubiquitin carboxyl-terminal hydrolase 4/11/15